MHFLCVGGGQSSQLKMVLGYCFIFVLCILFLSMNKCEIKQVYTVKPISIHSCAIVTGASSGIGEQISNLLQSWGFSVIAPKRDVLDLADKNQITQFINHTRDYPGCNLRYIYLNAGVHDDQLNDIINAQANIQIVTGLKDMIIKNNIQVIVTSSVMQYSQFVK